MEGCSKQRTALNRDPNHRHIEPSIRATMPSSNFLPAVDRWELLGAHTTVPSGELCRG